MSLNLKKADIRLACGDRYYARGSDYAHNDHVIGVRLQQEEWGWNIRAEVEGNAVYQQDIDLVIFPDSMEIDGECSCPVAYNCKHVAAALIVLADTGQQPPQAHHQRVIDHWLQRLAAASAPEHWQVELGQQALLYVMTPSAHGNGLLAVQLQTARVLKNGTGYGKPRILAPYQLDDYRVSAILQPVDHQIVRLLDASARHHYGYALDGETGAIALQRMLGTMRLHWQHIDTAPLQAGPPRQLLVAWQEHKQTMQFEARTEPPGGIPVTTDPPFYIDPHTGVAGPLLLDTGLDPRTLDALLSAPMIPQELCPAITERLLHQFPTLALPLPSAVTIDEIRDRAPTPVLTLSALLLQTSPRTQTKSHTAHVGFDYQGHRVDLPCEPISTIAAAGRLTRIYRDTEAETDALQQLLAYGFEPLPNAQPDTPGFALTGKRVADSAQQWQQFLDQELPRLQEAGWIIQRDEAFALQFLHTDTLELDVGEQGGWFDLSIGLEIDGQRMNLIPALADLIDEIDSPEALPDTESVLLDIGDSRWLSVPTKRIKPLLATLFDLFDRMAPDHDALRLSRIDATRLTSLDDKLVWRGGEELRALGERLRDQQGIAPVAPPPGLHAELRGYQLQGVAWLQFLRETGFGGVLADDMGLGKTVQTLAHLLLEKQAGRLDRPVLIVAPTSLMANWRHETARFTPDLSVLTLQGPQRSGRFADIPNYDLILTTYPLLPRDSGILLKHEFHSLILDEAQTIKNPRAKAAQIVRSMNARHRLCLTGTPMENHLGELWSLFHFLAPGYLGDEAQFKRLFRTPIEEHGNLERRQVLQRRIAPFLLRRTKQAVASELPAKVEIVRTVAMDGAQGDLYESVRAAMDKKVREALSRKGLARSHITILDALLKLRQICCDPRLVKLDHAHHVQQSAKLEMLLEMLPELLDEGRRILLFSQFTSMLGLIEQELHKRGIGYSKLTGQTRKREEAIDLFRSGGVSLFLISLKAGGVGLNLTEADTVIHYDPWWNPAVENQATDRAHRIGQTNSVFVYKLVSEKTVEEKILALQAKKAALASGLYRDDKAGDGLQFNEDDLRELFNPLD